MRGVNDEMFPAPGTMTGTDSWVERNPVDFARGGAAKAAPKAGAGGGQGGGIVSAIVSAISGQGSGYNGTINGKKGFQPGNTYGGKKGGARNSPVHLASRSHASARRVVSKHVQAGTLNTPQGRAALKTSAAAARELQSARATKRTEVAAARKATRAEAKATAATPKGQATTQLQAARAAAGPAQAAPAPAPAPKPAHGRKPEVVAASREAAGIKAERAATHLNDLHAGAKAGAFDEATAHKHVDRLARGHTKEELFAAARGAGIEHTAKTKKALVEHLKGHVTAAAKPAEAPKAPAPKAPTPKPAEAPKAPAHTPAGDHVTHLHGAFDKSKGSADNLVSLEEFRKHLGGTRESQDAAIREGRLAGHFSLHGHEGQTTLLTPAQNAASIHESSGRRDETRRLSYISRREDAPPRPAAVKPAATRTTPGHELPLKEFADRAVKAAHAAPGGGFGDEKTFISHAHAHLRKTDPAFKDVTPEQFKGRLVEAHKARHLELGRADLVEAMHPGDVRASSTRHGRGDYHFIRHPEAPGKGQSRSPEAGAATVPKAGAAKPASSGGGKVTPGEFRHALEKIHGGKVDDRQSDPAQVARTLGVPKEHVEATLHDLAAKGAVSYDYASPQQISNAKGYHTLPTDREGRPYVGFRVDRPRKFHEATGGGRS